LDPEDSSYWPSIPKSALRSAVKLNGEIERRTGQRPWVQAVVVLWSDFPEGLVEDGKCVFVHGSRLREWLEGRMRGRSERLGEGEVEAIAECVAGIGEGERREEVGAGSAGVSPV
jgi:hypothetical protein